MIPMNHVPKPKPHCPLSTALKTQRPQTLMLSGPDVPNLEVPNVPSPNIPMLQTLNIPEDNCPQSLIVPKPPSPGDSDTPVADVPFLMSPVSDVPHPAVPARSLTGRRGPRRG